MVHVSVFHPCEIDDLHQHTQCHKQQNALSPSLFFGTKKETVARNPFYIWLKSHLTASARHFSTSSAGIFYLEIWSKQHAKPHHHAKPRTTLHNAANVERYFWSKFVRNLHAMNFCDPPHQTSKAGKTIHRQRMKEWSFVMKTSDQGLHLVRIVPTHFSQKALAVRKSMY